MTGLTAQRYSRLAIALHWAIAAAIVANILIAWQFGGPPTPRIFALYQLHKSLGITVLLLSLLRLALRFLRPPPAPAATLSNLERCAAKTVHVAFYCIMIGLPLSGWALVSTSTLNVPTRLFGVIAWPHIAPLAELAAPARKAANEAAITTHELLAWLTYALLALHVGAVLKHAFVDRDDTAARMIPFLRRASRDRTP